MVWLSVINILVWIVIGLILKFYLPGYFNEKGKLLAQKEDIKAITESIEAVKFNFNKETEQLKAEITRVTNLQITHRTEERNAILNFYGTYNAWLYSLMEVNISIYNENNIDLLINKREYIDSFYAKSNIEHSIMRLVVLDNNIIGKSHELMVEIIKYKHWIDSRLLQLQFNLLYHKQILNQFDRISKVDLELAKSLILEEKTIDVERKEIINEYFKNRNSEYQNILNVDTIFADLVKSYIIQ